MRFSMIVKGNFVVVSIVIGVFLEWLKIINWYLWA